MRPEFIPFTDADDRAAIAWLYDVERAISAVLVDCDLGKLRPRLEAACDLCQQQLRVHRTEGRS